MQQIFNAAYSAARLSFALLMVLTASGFGAVYISDKDGNWGDPTTWGNAPGTTYPVAGDTAYANHRINVEAGHQCDVLHTGDGQSLIVNSGQSLTVFQGGTWGAGTIQGSGLFRLSGGTLSFGASPGVRYVRSGNFLNDGTVVQTDGRPLAFADGGYFVNRGTYTLQGDADITNAGGGTAWFRNQGLFLKSAGAGTSTIRDVRFEVSNGTVRVLSGTLRMSGAEGTSVNPTFDVAGGARYDLCHGVRAYFNGEIQGPGAGEVWLTGEGALAACSDSQDAYLYFTNGGFCWDSGSIHAYNNRTLVNRGLVRLEGTASKTLGAGCLRNEHVWVQTGAAPLIVASGAVYSNAASGVYEIQANGLVISNVGHFHNAGTIRKTAGAGEALIQGNPFNNWGGIIEVRTGTLVMAAAEGTMQGGRFTVWAGCVYELCRGVRAYFNGTFDGAGAGAVLFRSGTLALCTDGQETYFAFTNGGFRWEGGTMIPYSRALVNRGRFYLDGSDLKRFQTRGWVNEGVVQHRAGTLQLDSDAVLTNTSAGLYDFQADGLVVTGGGWFYNQGTVRKSAGAGESYFLATHFCNQGGTVEVQTGTLCFAGADGVSSSGTFTVAAGARLELARGYRNLFNGAYRGEGAGTVGLFTTGSTIVCCQDARDTSFSFTNGAFHWEAGDIHVWNNRSFINQGLMIVTGTPMKDLVGKMVNEGVMKLYGPGPLRVVISSSRLLSNAPNGRLEILGAGTNVSGAGYVFSSGTLIKPDGDYTSVWEAVVTVYGGECAVSSGVLRILRDVTVYGGVLRVAGGGFAFHQETKIWGGTLRGVGTIQNANTVDCRQGGRIEPGLSVGLLQITGGVAFVTNGILGIEIGGPVQGTDYDCLVVGGSATLGGTVEVSLVNGFQPRSNQVFEILRCASRSGAFAAVQPETWEVLYSATNVSLRWTAPSVEDSDGDGMPDWWETLHGLDPAVSNAPDADADSDGYTDLEEYAGDTDPMNNASYFPKITRVRGDHVLQITIPQTATSRVYDVWATTNLMAPQVWTPRGLNVRGTPSNLVLIVTNASPLQFFRTGAKATGP